MKLIMAEGAEIQDLIEKARTGDRKAFDELARPLTGYLLERIRLRMGRGLREKLEAEDVLQETLVRAFRSMPNFRWQGGGSLECWLEGIAVHFILQSVRAHRRRRELVLSKEPEAGDVSPSRRERRQERFQRLRKAIEDLSPDHRTVIRFSRIQGLKVKQIAERMGRSETAVRNLLLRALKELRESFGDTESLGLPAERLSGESGERAEGAGDGQ